MDYLVVKNLDVAVIVLYFAAVIGNGLYWSSKARHSGDFLLGGKSFGIFSTLCTQGATMKGSGALMGYSAGAYVNGAGVLISSQCYSLGAWGAILSGIARKLKKCSNIIDIRSSGDLFLKRFDSPILKKLSGIGGAWLALSIMSGNMAAVGLLIHLLFNKYGLTFEMSLIIGMTITIIYTTLGGLMAVVHNDVLQWLIMTPLIFIVVPVMLIVYGGATPTAIHKALDSAQYFSLRPNIWWLGYLLSGVLAACCDVNHLTRFITARNEKTAVKGSLLGFTFCTLLAGLVIFFGLTAAMLIDPAVVGDNKDGVILALVSRILPPGLVGLFLAATLAMTISTIDSNLNTSVLCITVDVIEPSLPEGVSEKAKLFYCRIVNFVIAALSIFFVLKVKGIVAIMGMGFNVYSSAFFVPLMSCMFWGKATEKGCLAGILTGGAMAIVAINMKLPLPVVWGVAVSLVCTVIVSLLTCNEKNRRGLLPGFNERGKKIDRQIFIACTLGACGSLIFSIGVGLWINWICIVAGVVGMIACIHTLDAAFKDYQAEA
ncbi:sodium:solute symporter family protein [Synergistes jonesii]|uniref:sodium:solute symporter family protein n=1 Tax=Synergistes jonesii TaxID=2754 RepID=UPI003330406F